MSVLGCVVWELLYTKIWSNEWKRIEWNRIYNSGFDSNLFPSSPLSFYRYIIIVVIVIVVVVISWSCCSKSICSGLACIWRIRRAYIQPLQAVWRRSGGALRETIGIGEEMECIERKQRNKGWVDMKRGGIIRMSTWMVYCLVNRFINPMKKQPKRVSIKLDFIHYRKWISL